MKENFIFTGLQSVDYSYNLIDELSEDIPECRLEFIEIQSNDVLMRQQITIVRR